MITNNTEDNQQQQPNQQDTTKKTQQAKSTTPVLDVFGRDLNKMALEGKLDECIGREHEIDRVVQILSRKKKNNPALIGEAGTGKSTIAQALAQKIITKKVSRVLHNKRIFSLDLTSIMAGTRFRGDFEARMKAILEEVEQNPEIILFADEAHTLLGLGNSTGALDAANIIKPYLANGMLQLIIATTHEEYRALEKDKALERRFQKVVIEPTTLEQTKTILYNIKGSYEDFHNVKFSDAAIEAAVNLSDRYINHRNFPDKAIDIIDETGSRVHIDNLNVPNNIIELEKQAMSLFEKKNKHVKMQEYEKAAKVRDTEKELQKQIERESSKWEESEKKKDKIIINEEDIIKVVARMVGIPIEKMTEKENEKLLKLTEILKQRVVGQDEAVVKIAEAIQVSRSGIGDAKRPISFLFLGSSGIGKTESAKAIAEYLFNDEDAMIRLDMPEMSEAFGVTKLIGSSAGFVGYEDSNQLTDKVRLKPYSVVLLDEIEKASPDVLRLLLAMLDEGRMTDAKGTIVDFRNTIVIMTSNIGTKEISENKVMGYGTDASMKNKKSDMDAIVEKALKKKFLPEFLNRIGDKVIFNQLDEESISRISDLHIDKFVKEMSKQEYVIEVGNKLRKYIAKEGFSPEYGARPLLRVINNLIRKNLAKEILKGNIKKDKNKILIDWNDKKEEVFLKK